MPVYKYTLKNGKTMWYAAFNYTDWTGQNRHTCKRRFKTQREAKEYERPFLDQEKNTSDILFSSLVENYLEDMERTQEHYEQFSIAIQKSSVKLAFDILFYTGMRPGELLALTSADILPSKLVGINKNYAKVKGEELFLEPKTPKAKRCISIPEFLYDDIHEYISKLNGIGKGDRIFYFIKSAMEKEIKRASEKAELTPIRVHDLRHSHASMLIELGFTPLEIAGRQTESVPPDTSARRKHLKPYTDCGILNIKKDTCW